LREEFVHELLFASRSLLPPVCCFLAQTNLSKEKSCKARQSTCASSRKKFQTKGPEIISNVIANTLLSVSVFRSFKKKKKSHQSPHLLMGTLTEAMKARHVVCLIAAVVIAAAGIVLAVCAQMFVNDIIRAELPMKNSDSLLFKIWQDSNNQNLPLVRNFYVWNLTNPWEVYERKEVPNFVKIGPYAYREHMYAPMESIEWSDDRTQLSFHYVSEFHWAADLSIDPVVGQLHENDTFTTLNLALWSGVYRVSKYPDIPINGPVMHDASCLTMGLVHDGTVVGHNGYFIQPKVGEYLFGYRDDIWWALQNESSLLPNYDVPSIFRTSFNNSQPAPSPYTYESGLTCPIWDNQSQCNGTGTQKSIIYTGVGDLSKIAQYVKWAGQDSFWWWNNDDSAHAGALPEHANQSCQAIRGSNAMNYPPGLTRDDTPYVFVDNIFRSVKLQYTKDVTVSNVPTLQFGIAQEEKDPHSANSECYQTRYPAVFNLSSPYFAPMLVSQPYFWGVPNASQVFVDEPDLPAGQRGDAIVLNFTINGVPAYDLIESMDPSEAELVLQVEPTTGTLMHANGRIQLGTWMRPITGCDGYFEDLQPTTTTNITTNVTTSTYFPYTMMPVLYLDRTVTAPEDLAHKLYLYVVLSVLLGRILGSFIAGSAFVGAFVMIRRLRRRAVAELSEREVCSAVNESSKLMH
jgi:hypothetical protein